MPVINVFSLAGACGLTLYKLTHPTVHVVESALKDHYSVAITAAETIICLTEN